MKRAAARQHLLEQSRACTAGMFYETYVVHDWPLRHWWQRKKRFNDESINVASYCGICFMSCRNSLDFEINVLK